MPAATMHFCISRLRRRYIVSTASQERPFPSRIGIGSTYAASAPDKAADQGAGISQHKTNRIRLMGGSYAAGTRAGANVESAHPESDFGKSRRVVVASRRGADHSPAESACKKRKGPPPA